jgi:hypothetical protein
MVYRRHGGAKLSLAQSTEYQELMFRHGFFVKNSNKVSRRVSNSQVKAIRAVARFSYIRCFSLACAARIFFVWIPTRANRKVASFESNPLPWRQGDRKMPRIRISARLICRSYVIVRVHLRS